MIAGGGGGLTVLLFLVYQFYAPRYLNRDTALAPIVEEVPEKVNDLAEEQTEIREDMDGRFSDVEKQLEMQMQVQRAQARATPMMDEERVDQYLMKNGVEVGDFLLNNDDKEDDDDGE